MRSGPNFIRPRPEPLGNLSMRWIYPCRDGHVCLAFQGGGGAPIKSGREMVAWANEEGYALKIRDYRWETWDSGTMEQAEQDFLQEEIGKFLATKTKAELLEVAAKRRILLAPVYTVADLPENPQLSFRGYWNPVYHPELDDTLTYPGPSVKVDQCPQKIRLRAPTIGEHNREVYVDELGLSEEQLHTLEGTVVI
jgi:crotonobetainyl-CoA:carnitine CoA-transferase CaiB-like acyl-CoA transferase